MPDFHIPSNSTKKSARSEDLNFKAVALWSGERRWGTKILVNWGLLHPNTVTYARWQWSLDFHLADLHFRKKTEQIVIMQTSFYGNKNFTYVPKHECTNTLLILLDDSKFNVSCVQHDGSIEWSIEQECVSRRAPFRVSRPKRNAQGDSAQIPTESKWAVSSEKGHWWDFLKTKTLLTPRDISWHQSTCVRTAKAWAKPKPR